jgi:thermostable 8-oxoguanine DNA glycosylase
MITSLKNDDSQTNERQHARILANKLIGFGPKQSRNFIQTLGLSKYEIPIDSRIIKWLNAFGFPLKISSIVLQDAYFYEYILDVIRELCDRAEIYPCMLDAVIFASFDNDEWTEETMFS